MEKIQIEEYTTQHKMCSKQFNHIKSEIEQV